MLRQTPTTEMMAIWHGAVCRRGKAEGMEKGYARAESGAYPLRKRMRCRSETVAMPLLLGFSGQMMGE